MIPNDFGIIRQTDRNLLACIFPTLTDLSEYRFEIIHPEYIDGYYMAVAGGISPGVDWSYSITDVSKYDKVLIPMSSKTGSSYYSGLNETGAGQSLSNRCIAVKGSGSYNCVWGCLEVDATHKMACVNVANGDHLPIIGFIRHRTDEVNPGG